MLREQANLNAARLAGRAISAALDPGTDPVKAANLALGIIREAEPREQSTLEIEGPVTSERVNEMSLSELIAFASANGIEVPSGLDSTPPQLSA